ncbi:hypothetical protein [Coxiella-like endosymbiont]|uniref:hypothetical protein n=1 Tax=Coxiella-like endosymbiont TaxID=1592897 RepID=UPI00272DB6EB|nr:hypothetical protein [Coxiella-like endosymbiont]
MRCVNLLERSEKGSIILDGENLTLLSEKALRWVSHQMDMIFQHFNLLSTRTVYQKVAFPLQLIRKSKTRN